MEESTIKNYLTDGKNDFEYMEGFSEDSLGELYRAKNINDNQTYLIRTLIMKEEGSEHFKKINNEIKEVLELLKRIERSRQKKNGLSKYYGFYIGPTINRYNLIFEDIYAFPDNDSRKNDWELLFFNIVEGFAILQKMQIFPKELLPNEIYAWSSLHKRFVIDLSKIRNFGISEEKYLQNVCFDNRKYYSPEKLRFLENDEGVLIDPFKSELFSFTLIICEMILGDLPKKLNNEGYYFAIERKLNMISVQFKNHDKIFECLSEDSRLRPDFVNIFDKYYTGPIKIRYF